MGTYYDGTKLLSMLDINGTKPEIYMCTTNRTGGKTTYFNRMAVNRFLSGKGKFCLVYRFNYELDECAEKFFKDIKELFFRGLTMESKAKAKGLYHVLFLDGKPCGYAISLNSADILKKHSHIFNDVTLMLFDEFQSETNHYCPNEVRKLMSVHTSIARGQGKQVRYVPVIMIGNPVSMLNPYYVSLGISSRLNDKVNFLRGDGFVLEQGYIDSVAKAQQESGFNKAFASESYSAYSSQCVYLNDTLSFIEKPNGKCNYIATLKYNGKEYSIKEYPELGIMYCDDKADTTFKFKLSVTTDDHNVNYVMLKRQNWFVEDMRFYFDRGCFRFKNLQCKQAMLTALSY